MLLNDLSLKFIDVSLNFIYFPSGHSYLSLPGSYLLLLCVDIFCPVSQSSEDPISTLACTIIYARLII